MPDGVIAEVRDGFATIDFVDGSLKGPALSRLLEIGGPGSIEVLTRDGPRRRYRTAEGNAGEAGLLDSSGDVVRGDQGAAQALADADVEAREAPSRPDAPTSRNVFAGETSFAEARESTEHVATTVQSTDVETPVKRGPGRPRKVPPPEA